MTSAMTPLLITGRRFIAWLISEIAAPEVVETDRPTLVRLCVHPYFPARRCPHCGMGGLEDFLMTNALQIVTATGAHDFQVEITSDDASRTRGLSGRRSMPANHGMLFKFEREAPRTFQMRDTYIPLDIIFISRAGVVSNVVANAQTLSERPIHSGQPCSTVLELNGGTAARIGLKVGDKDRHAAAQTGTDPHL
jgi:uncharacterized protein